MAREIVISLGGKASRFTFSKVSRQKMYGMKKTVVVDGDGEACDRGLIPMDGDVVIPKGGTSTIYIDDDFQMFSRKDLDMFGPDGEKLEIQPSTLGEEQEARVVDPQQILDHSISSVYALTPSEIDDGTSRKLKEGGILETAFNYYAGYSPSTLFIMERPEGLFGLVGEPTGFEYCSQDVTEAVMVEEADEDDDDFDMDFGML